MTVCSPGVGSATAPRCPACGAAVTVADDVFVGEAVWCSECGVELEVVSTAPPVLDVYEEEEK